jgi:hypothetical protein
MTSDISISEASSIWFYSDVSLVVVRLDDEVSSDFAENVKSTNPISARLKTKKIWVKLFRRDHTFV